MDGVQAHKGEVPLAELVARQATSKREGCPGASGHDR